MKLQILLLFEDVLKLLSYLLTEHFKNSDSQTYS